MSMLLDTINIFNQIKNTAGKNDKITAIKLNKDNIIFIESIKFLLDGNITTGIAAKKYDKIHVRTSDLNISNDDLDNEYLNLLQYVKQHNTGKEEDILMVKSFCYNTSDDVKEFIRGIVTKSIKIGIDYKSANKAIPGLISTWEVQQAYPISDKNYPKHGEYFFLTQKLNGNNCGYLDGKLISRQGKEFTGLDHIIKDIESLPYKDMFFNGELIRKNYDGLSDDENFQIGTGIINSDEIDKSCIKFVIYEMFPKDEFLNGKSRLKYKDRREKYLGPLSNEIKSLETDNLEVVGIVYQGTDLSKIDSELTIADNNNWEGLMLNKDTLWQNKRNNGILKVKSFKHCDILCKRLEEGEGKYSGTLGNIICDYKGFELGVGSGFTDAQREYYWNNPDEIIDRVVQIKYKTETKNKDGGISVQFPVFECVREIGKEVSYN